MQQEYRTFVGVTMPISTVEKVKDFQKRHRLKSKGDAVNQLVNTSLLIESKIGLVESWSSNDVSDLKYQLESGQLVDWVENLDVQKFTAMMHIFEDERKARGLNTK